jgi:hypothetical protein
VQGSGEIVATPNMFELVCEYRLQLCFAETLDVAFRQKNDGAALF